MLCKGTTPQPRATRRIFSGRDVRHMRLPLPPCERMAHVTHTHTHTSADLVLLRACWLQDVAFGAGCGWRSNARCSRQARKTTKNITKNMRMRNTSAPWRAPGSYTRTLSRTPLARHSGGRSGMRARERPGTMWPTHCQPSGTWPDGTEQCAARYNEGEVGHQHNPHPLPPSRRTLVMQVPTPHGRRCARAYVCARSDSTPPHICLATGNGGEVGH